MGNLKKMLNSISKGEDTRHLVIAQKLDKLFLKDRNMRGERTGLHASSIIASDNDFCLREQVLSFFFKKNVVDLPIGLLKIFAEGEAIHEKWQNMFVRHGLAQKEDIECRKHVKKYDLYMTPDAKIQLGNKKVIVEIKSMNTFSFQRANTHPSGAKQCKFYLHFHPEYDYGIVLMEDKNTQQNKIQIVERDEELIKPYIKRLLDIKKYKKIFEEENKAPKRHKTCKDKTCKKAESCSMKDACWNINRIKI
jgi:hypothetical protein